MELTLVTKEQSKLLKELGFDWFTLSYYDRDDEWTMVIVADNYNHHGYASRKSAPTLDLACKWLRDKHGIFVTAHPITKTKYWFDVEKLGNISSIILLYDSVLNDDITFDTYDSALSAGIDYALEYLIKNKK